VVGNVKQHGDAANHDPNPSIGRHSFCLTERDVAVSQNEHFLELSSQSVVDTPYPCCSGGSERGVELGVKG
jgi:hypothetical protein